MKVYRAPQNPIVKPQDVKPSRQGYEVVCAFNAGVIRVDDEVLLLLRIAERPVNNNPEVYLSPILDVKSGELVIREFDKNAPGHDFSDSRVFWTPEGMFLTSISHLRIARSKDGIHFEIDEHPAVFPENEYEIYGVEDPRITQIEDTYYINYSAIAPVGITTCLVSTKDFRTFQRLGAVFAPDNKDVAIFPEKINGKYYALQRPQSGVFKKADIWIAESPDLICWGNHRFLMGARKGYWDSGRVGASAVPFRIPQGWLEIYHGATEDHRYCLGAVLLDANEPWKVLARCEKPIMEPEAEYEVNGFFGNVIFNCGVLYEEGKVKVYYGAADTYMGYAEIGLSEILKVLAW